MVEIKKNTNKSGDDGDSNTRFSKITWKECMTDSKETTGERVDFKKQNQINVQWNYHLGLFKTEHK